MKEEIMLVFGASSTWGAWDFEKGGWVNRLRLFLDNRETEDYFEVYNLGISGDNTRGLLKRIEIECEARNPTTIIISIGENDSAKNSYVYVPLEEFEKNMLKIIKISKKITSKIILLGTKRVDESKTNPVPWDKSVSYTNKDFEEYDKVIMKVAKKEKISYLKMSDLMNKEDLEDGIHPNIKGHEKIFQRVKDFLINKKIIK